MWWFFKGVFGSSQKRWEILCHESIR